MSRADPRPKTWRPVPNDFATVAPTMTKTRLAAHYRSSDEVVGRWLAETGIQPATFIGRQAEPLPADFAERAGEMHCAALARHYKAHFSLVQRWLDRTSIKAKPFRRPAEAQRTPTVSRRAPVAQKRAYTAANHLSRDASTEGQAADVLRRFVAVYRCTERGAADPAGSHWRYGNAVLTGDELVARAKRHGFDPDAWRRLPTNSPSRRQGLAQQQGAM